MKTELSRKPAFKFNSVSGYEIMLLLDKFQLCIRLLLYFDWSPCKAVPRPLLIARDRDGDRRLRARQKGRIGDKLIRG